MKRVFALLLAALLLIVLSGCARLESIRKLELPPLPEVSHRPEVLTLVASAPSEEAEQKEEAPAEAQPEESAAEADPGVVVNFSKSMYEAFDPAEGQQKILTFSYVTPNVSIEGREEAGSAINEYLAMLDETYYTGNDYGDGYSSGYYGMLEMAEDNFTYVRENGIDLPLEYFSERDAGALRADSRVLTLQYSSYEYTGGAHGMYSHRCFNFDTQTGELIRLEQLTGDLEAFAGFAVEKMREQLENDPPLADMINNYLAGESLDEALLNLLREGSWNFDGEGLVFFSDLYELAPYAAGIQSFRISYDELNGLLLPKWLPPEKSGEGELRFLPMDALEEGSVELIGKVTAAEDGQEYCLIGSGAVYDVCLRRVSYIQELSSYSVGDQLWCSSALSDKGLQLQAALPELVPDLMLSYFSGGERHQCLLAQSGADGSPILMDSGFSLIEY